MSSKLGVEIKTSAQLAKELGITNPTGSTSITVLSILKAIDGFNQEIEGDWLGIDQYQKAFLENCYSYIKQLHRYPENELFGKVSNDYTVLNAFLKQHEFDIQLAPFDENSIGVVAILKLLLKWREPAETATIMHEGTVYPAVKMKNDIRLFMSPASDKPILGIRPQRADTYVMMVPADARYEGVHLFLRVMQLVKGIKAMPPRGYDSIEAIFPMISLDNEADIKWLINMEKGDGWYVSQALQQSKLSMNQYGAKAESATAMVMTRGIPEIFEYVIDQPFFFFTVDIKTSFPTFTAYLEPDSWKEPEGFE